MSSGPAAPFAFILPIARCLCVKGRSLSYESTQFSFVETGHFQRWPIFLFSQRKQWSHNFNKDQLKQEEFLYCLPSTCFIQFILHDMFSYNCISIKQVGPFIYLFLDPPPLEVRSYRLTLVRPSVRPSGNFPENWLINFF